MKLDRKELSDHTKKTSFRTLQAKVDVLFGAGINFSVNNAVAYMKNVEALANLLDIHLILRLLDQ